MSNTKTYTAYNVELIGQLTLLVKSIPLESQIGHICWNNGSYEILELDCVKNILTVFSYVDIPILPAKIVLTIAALAKKYNMEYVEILPNDLPRNLDVAIAEIVMQK